MKDPFTNHKRYEVKDCCFGDCAGCPHRSSQYRFPTLGVLSVLLLILLGLLLFVVPGLVEAIYDGS